jgi:hypothetical protein
MVSPFARGDSLTAEFPDKVTHPVPFKARPFALEDVRLLDSPFKTAMDHNAKWLLDLEPDRFLSWFRKEAGLEPKAPAYEGWEQNTIAGHSLGHYLSACAMMYAATSDKRFRDRTDYIVDELALCQKANNSGYMSAFPGGKTALAEVSRGEIRSKGFDLNGIWVPWYTQHKLMAGLRDTYEYTHNPKALAVWTAHADWIVDLLKNLTPDQWQKMLACEHGGTNETFADLYGITGDTKYLDTARKFYHKAVLDPLSLRQDALAGLHANTQIPKIIGSARIHELTADPKFATIASFFWDTVVGHYTYANGGNSANEHFAQPDHLAQNMHDTTETCNTYNMLKLTRHLFAWQPDAKYIDYYERALINHILAHQHPEDGGRIVYKGFLDMPAKKSFSHPTKSFWCCVGTGMENHTKYADTIYFHSNDTLFVNLFIPSVLTWKDKSLTLTQKTDFPEDGSVTFSFACDKPAAISLKIRKPYWTESPTIILNGKKLESTIGPDGCIELNRIFTNGDTVGLDLPMTLHTSTLPDMPNRTAFLCGPTLLAAELTPLPIQPVLVSPDTPSLLKSFRRTPPLHFTSDNIGYQVIDSQYKTCPINLIPLYTIAEQPYTVYVDVFTPQEWKQKQAEYAAEQERLRQIKTDSADILDIGTMQSERDHNLTGDATATGTFGGRKWRHAYNGWFEFEMKVFPDKPTSLLCTYWGSDGGQRTFDVLIDGRLIATQKLDSNKPGDFFDATYPIPADLTKDRQKVKVRLKSHPDNFAGGLFGVRTIKTPD